MLVCRESLPSKNLVSACREVPMTDILSKQGLFSKSSAAIWLSWKSVRLVIKKLLTPGSTFELAICRRVPEKNG